MREKENIFDGVRAEMFFCEGWRTGILIQKP
jgi:hypothetical protein